VRSRKGDVEARALLELLWEKLFNSSTSLIIMLPPIDSHKSFIPSKSFDWQQKEEHKTWAKKSETQQA